MAYKNYQETLTFKAASDFSDDQFAIVELTANAHEVELGAAGEGLGVVQNHPQSGEAATVALAGVTKVKCGGAVSVGQKLTSAATGWAALVTSGALPTRYIGRALTAAASGGVATMLIEQSITTSGVAN